MAKDGEILHSALTLRFKCGRQTILLLAEPVTPFSNIKSELLAVLHERYPQGLPSSASPNPTNIPESIDDVLLGVPVDAYDPSKGWTELATSGGGIRETPQSLGLKDGSVLAFAFIGTDENDAQREFLVEWSSYDEQYGDGGDTTEDIAEQ